MSRTALAPLFVLPLLVGCGTDVQFPDGGATWNAPPTPAYTSQPRLAFTDNGDDTLAFVTPDPTTPQFLGFAPIGNSPIELEGPHHLAKSPDGAFIFYNLSNYVTNGGSGPHGAHGTGVVPGSLVKLDAHTNRSVGQALVDRNPGDLLISPDGKFVYVSHYDIARLTAQLQAGKPAADGYSGIVAVHADTMTAQSEVMICPTAHGMGFSPDHTRLYATCSLSDELAVLDLSDPQSPTLVQKLFVGPAPGPAGQPNYAPYALAVQSNGLVWVSNNQSGDVRVYDPATGKMDPQKIVHVGGIAMFADWSADGKFLYVPHQGDDVVSEIDVTAVKKTRDLPLPKDACLNAHVLKLLNLQGEAQPPSAAVVCEGDHLVRKGSVVFLDLQAWKTTASVPLGLFPDGVIQLP